MVPSYGLATYVIISKAVSLGSQWLITPYIYVQSNIRQCGHNLAYYEILSIPFFFEGLVLDPRIPDLTPPPQKAEVPSADTSFLYT